MNAFQRKQRRPTEPKKQVKIEPEIKKEQPKKENIVDPKKEEVKIPEKQDKEPLKITF